MSAGYFGFGASIFRKSSGKIPLGSRILFAPFLLGQWLSLRHYQRHCNAWDELAPNVWIGRKLTDREATEAGEQGITAILDLTGEFTEPPAFRALNYRNIPVLDLTAPTPEQVDEAVSFIDRHRQHGVVYIHCKIGYSRTAAVAGAWLIKNGVVPNADAAIKMLRKVRPTIVVRKEARQVLENIGANSK